MGLSATRFDYGEVRVYAIGLVNGMEITMIDTDISQNVRRVISANAMKEKRTGTMLGSDRTDRKRTRGTDDRQIRRALESDPDVQPTELEFWKKARVVLPKPKQTITIRLDADLLGWLRKQKGYQTRIHSVLRSYMNAKLASHSRKHGG